jgi:hypothetical protein
LRFCPKADLLACLSEWHLEVSDLTHGKPLVNGDITVTGGTLTNAAGGTIDIGGITFLVSKQFICSTGERE